MSKAISYLNSPEGKSFIAWWKNHRHSGYAVKGMEMRWTIRPHEAVCCDRYIAEFFGDSRIAGKTRHNYEAQEIESWAAAQKKYAQTIQA